MFKMKIPTLLLRVLGLFFKPFSDATADTTAAHKIAILNSDFHGDSWHRQWHRD